MDLEQWPSLVEDEKTSSPTEEADDWEYVSGIDSDVDDIDNSNNSSSCEKLKSKFEEAPSSLEGNGDNPIIHRCESTPEFSSYSSLGSIQVVSDDEYSFLNDCNSSVAVESISTSKDDTILLSHKPKKVPSFKDMILLNAEKLKEEESKRKEASQKLEEQRRNDALLRRKQTKTRIIVTPIKRCARSTGDLRSLIIHEGEEGYSGLSSPCSAVIHEDEEILGCSDAQEYYDRKSHGSNGRAKGRRIRPDEAKRKEMIIHKKNAQRRAQGAKQKD